LRRLAKGPAVRYTIRELKLGEILDEAIRLTKDHFGVFLGIVGVLMIPFSVIGGLIEVAMRPTLPPNPTPDQSLAANLEILKVSTPLALMAMSVINPITEAALVYGIANAYLEKPISVGASFKRAFQRLLPLIGTGILVGLAIFGGSLLCLVPGILAALWFSLATQVVILEDMAGIDAMKRSKALMAGNIGTIFVLGLLVGLINGGITVTPHLIPQPHVSAVAVAIAEGIVMIFSSAAFVVFYFSCRCKHEQFDLMLLAESVAAEAPGKVASDPDLQW
jgi:hypothetical protein